MKDELSLIAGATTIAGASLGSITVATIPVAVTTSAPAWGIAGWMGFTTTTTTVVASPVIVPAAAIVAVGALLGYGVMKAHECMKSQEG